MRDHTVRIYHEDTLLSEQQSSDPLAFIEDYQAQFRVPEVEGLPRFTGGLVGYFAYDSVRLFEKKLAKINKPDPLNVPDIQLMLSEEVVVFDNLKESVFIITHVNPVAPDAYQAGQVRLLALAQQLQQGDYQLPVEVEASTIHESDFVSSFGQEAYKASVERIKEYILAGDVMQVVPSTHDCAI